jgi:hypothetical protein
LLLLRTNRPGPPKASYNDLEATASVSNLSPGRRSLIILLLMLSFFPALLIQTVSSQQFTTVTLGVSTTTDVTLFNTTILSLNNVTKTVVQTTTLTSQMTISSVSTGQITLTDTLTSVNVKTVGPTFLESNAGWLLPLVVFVSVFAVLVVAARIFALENS